MPLKQQPLLSNINFYKQLYINLLMKIILVTVALVYSIIE